MDLFLPNKVKIIQENPWNTISFQSMRVFGSNVPFKSVDGCSNKMSLYHHENRQKYEVIGQTSSTAF